MTASLESRAAAIGDCRQALQRALTDARSQWDDSVRSSFDQRYAEPVLLAARKIASELADLAGQLASVIRDLESLGLPMVAHHLVGLRVPPSPLSEVRTHVTQLGQRPADRVADARPTPAARSITFLRSSLCRFSQSASAETSHAAMGTQRTGRTDLLCTAHRPTGMPWWWRQSRRSPRLASSAESRNGHPR